MSNKNFRKSSTYRQRIFNNDFLREPLKENPVFTDIKILLFMLKATGLFPIFTKVSHYKIAAPNRLMEYYSLFMRCMVYALTIFFLYKLIGPGSTQWFFSKRPTDMRNKWIEITLNIISFSITVIVCGYKTHTFIKIINDILEVDKEIRDKYRVIVNNDCGFSSKFVVFIYICLAYIFGLRIVMEYNKISLSRFILIAFLVIKNGLPLLFIVFTVSLLRIIKMRFAFLNWIMTGYTYKVQGGLSRRIRCFGDFRPMKRFPEDSLFLFRLHKKLLLVYASVNDCCSSIVMCYMGYAFFTITMNMYQFLLQFVTQLNKYSEIVQWTFIWIILHTLLLMLLCRGCGQVTREINAFPKVLARVYCENKHYLSTIDNYLFKNIKQTVQFTVHGFFVIDDSTIFKVFLAVVTYLVILVQFKLLEDSILEQQAAL